MTKHILIEGKVQGVGFRFRTTEKAINLGVSGWVQNLDDGRVEVLAHGEDSAVERLLDWIKNGGPPTAEVKDVHVEDTDVKHDRDHFYIKRGD